MPITCLHRHFLHETLNKQECNAWCNQRCAISRITWHSQLWAVASRTKPWLNSVATNQSIANGLVSRGPDRGGLLWSWASYLFIHCHMMSLVRMFVTVKIPSGRQIKIVAISYYSYCWFRFAEYTRVASRAIAKEQTIVYLRWPCCQKIHS